MRLSLRSFLLQIIFLVMNAPCSTTQASKGPSLQNTSTSVASAVAPVSISLEPVVFGEASGTEKYALPWFLLTVQ